MEVEKSKTFDQLFLDEGVEETDISNAFTAHNLEAVPEYKELMAEM